MTLLQKQFNEQSYSDAVEKSKRLLAKSPDDLRRLYGDKPITFLNIYQPDILFPAKIRQLFALIWSEKYKRIIVAGPRGGGKSNILGNVGFCKWFFQGRNIVDMAGSLAQAQIVYNYFAAICYSDKAVLDGMEKEPTISMSKRTDRKYFKCVAASQKQVRGPHPDTLFADEACETDDELLLAAMPMVDTSQTPLVVMTSTFHKVFGLFQEVWDNAPELGYHRFKWDIIDVVKSFDPIIFDDPRLNLEIKDLQELKKLCGDRTGDPEGWIPISNVIQAWREKPTLEYFLVEYMGSRPSAAGLVIDPVLIDEGTFDDAMPNAYNYISNAEVVFGLDWGWSGMTAVVGLMSHTNGVKVEKYLKTYTKIDLSIIIEDTIVEVLKFKVKMIYADSAGAFENRELQNALNSDPRMHAAKLKCTVVAVVFSKYKKQMLGNYRAYWEQKKIKIPVSHKIAIWQHKRYRYIEGSDEVQKKDDHIPDATQLALKHWMLNVRTETVSSSNTDEQLKRITGGLMGKSF